MVDGNAASEGRVAGVALLDVERVVVGMGGPAGFDGNEELAGDVDERQLSLDKGKNVDVHLERSGVDIKLGQLGLQVFQVGPSRGEDDGDVVRREVDERGECREDLALGRVAMGPPVSGRQHRMERRPDVLDNGRLGLQVLVSRYTPLFGVQQRREECAHSIHVPPRPVVEMDVDLHTLAPTIGPEDGKPFGCRGVGLGWLVFVGLVEHGKGKVLEARESVVERLVERVERKGEKVTLCEKGG